MKRLLALLLALLLTASCAFVAAENGSRVMTVSWTADEAAIGDYLSLLGVEGDDRGKIAGIVAQLMNTTKIVSRYDDANTETVLTIKDTELIRETVHFDGDAVRMQMNVLPGIVLENEPASLETQLITDMDGFVRACGDALNAWLDGQDGVQEIGVFTGLAFDGGDACTTYAFDDAKLAELVGELIPVMRDHVNANEDVLIDQLELLNQRVKKDNAYAYQLRKISRNGAVIGYGLTCTQGEDTMLTLSVNAEQEDQLRLVLCYGEGGMVCYEDVALTMQGDVSCEWKHYETDGVSAFPLVAAEEPLMQLTAALVGNETEGTMASVMSVNGEDKVGVLVDYSMADDKLNLTASTLLMDQTNKTCWTLNIETVDGPALQPVEGNADEKILSMDDLNGKDSGVFMQAMDEGMETMLTKLFFVLPSDLLVYLLMLGM